MVSGVSPARKTDLSWGPFRPSEGNGSRSAYGTDPPEVMSLLTLLVLAALAYGVFRLVTRRNKNKIPDLGL